MDMNDDIKQSVLDTEKVNLVPKREHNAKVLFSVFNTLYQDYLHNNLVGDTVEICNLNISLLPVEDGIIDMGAKQTNTDYVKSEIEWYNSLSLNVYSPVNIANKASLWEKVSDKNGYVNSNYGYLIYHKNNYEQFNNAYKLLCSNINSRQALMIYQRPTMHYEYNMNGRHDFICTNYVHCMIRDTKLIYIVDMRSNDAIYGFFNDFAWHCNVYYKFLKMLNLCYNNSIQEGNIIWKANSFHVYKKHFKLLTKIMLAN